jgi:hypothetical protein
VKYLHVEQEAAETSMNSHLPDRDPDAWPAPTDLSDSVDIRLLVAGRLTPTAIPIRRDRAELAAVLGYGDGAQPRADTRAHMDSERNVR